MNHPPLDFSTLYAGQEFLTPGESETVDIVGRTCSLPEGALVLELASGKGEAASLLAARHGWRVLGVDRYVPFLRDAAAKVKARLLGGSVGFVRADGAQAPVPDACFDLALCLGGPSIVGMDRCLSEMARALKTGGWLAISDLVWRKRPVPPAAFIPTLRAHGLTEESVPLLDELAAIVRKAGFEVVLAEALPSSGWDEYYGPMLQTLARLREEHAQDAEVQAWAEEQWQNEPRVFYQGLGREYWGYAVVIARRI